jgi:YegS/Rv2252/BmrU family lipid kinase
MKSKAVVIYNPFSGRKKTIDLKKIVTENIDHNRFSIDFWPTEKSSDVILFTDRAIKEKYEYVFAAGGDGTLNQIASRLVYTNLVLGIIPLGSGNGFARHFKIPIKTTEAIKALSIAQVKLIDTVWFNRHCMINVGGIGFDAHISALFATNKKRGLMEYVKTIVKHLNYKSQYYQIINKEKVIWHGKAFLISIANATQWGNNVKVHTGALPDDGLYNIVVLKSFSIFSLPSLIKNLLEGNLTLNKNSITFVGSDFKVVRENEGPIHVDGEPIWLGNEININIEPLSLKILSNE